jgi:hypothetical protein
MDTMQGQPLNEAARKQTLRALMLSPEAWVGDDLLARAGLHKYGAGTDSRGSIYSLYSVESLGWVIERDDRLGTVAQRISERSYLRLPEWTDPRELAHALVDFLADSW